MRRLLAVALAVVGCVPSTNPDKGRYSCTTAVDCGDGYECRKQFSGGGRCYKLGECIDVELCDGVDDNCDGRVDESFPDAGAGCDTTKQGLCKTGALTCTAGSVVCAQTVQPTTEVCNQLDDDCNGQVDDGFDLTSDNANCGRCGATCDAGTSCGASACRESTCGDGVDNDLNGATDCNDESCTAQVCQELPAPAWRCAVAPDGGVTDAGVPVRGCFPP